MTRSRRADDIRQWGHLYTWHAPVNQRPGLCFYCGSPAGTVDLIARIRWAESRAFDAGAYPE